MKAEIYFFSGTGNTLFIAKSIAEKIYGRLIPIRTLKQIINLKNCELSAVYGIHMPQNAFLKGWENNDKIIDKCGGKIELVTKNIDILRVF